MDAHVTIGKKWQQTSSSAWVAVFAEFFGLRGESCHLQQVGEPLGPPECPRQSRPSGKQQIEFGVSYMRVIKIPTSHIWEPTQALL